MLAQVISSLTEFLRFDGALYEGGTEFQSNLVSFLRIPSCFAAARRRLTSELSACSTVNGCHHHCGQRGSVCSELNRLLLQVISC